jgi:hypothetical protein
MRMAMSTFLAGPVVFVALPVGESRAARAVSQGPANPGAAGVDQRRGSIAKRVQGGRRRSAASRRPSRP